jgi:putative transposase
MHEIVATRTHCGYRRVRVMLEREGWPVGRNVVYRPYHEKGLVLRTKRSRRRKMAVHREHDAARSGRTRRGAWTSSMDRRREIPDADRRRGRVVDLWAYHHNARIYFSRPGKPANNAYIETFNGSPRDECLNIQWFWSIAQARRLIEA